MGIGWGSGLYKVGCAQEPNQRYRTLRHGNPQLKLLHAARLGPVQSYACEKALHRKFASQRYEGEIFALSPGQLEQAIEFIDTFSQEFVLALEGIPR